MPAPASRPSALRPAEPGAGPINRPRRTRPRTARPQPGTRCVVAAMMPLVIILAFGLQRAGAADETIGCAISREPDKDGIGIVARVWSDRPASGTYLAVVTKTDIAGSAVVQQSGRFDIDGGSSRTLARSTIEAPGSARIAATLTVEVAGRPVCLARLE